MKYLIKLEAIGLFVLFSVIYFNQYTGTFEFYLLFFFIPDVSFILFVISKKLGVIAYNIFHHQGVLAILFLFGYLFHNDLIMKIGLIFLAHSTFDRVAGYGLKYFDNFDHTHLGWVGKSKHLNKDT